MNTKRRPRTFAAHFVASHSAPACVNCRELNDGSYMKRILVAAMVLVAAGAWGQSFKADDFVGIESLKDQCDAGALMRSEPTMKNGIKAGHCLGYIRGIQEYIFFRNMFDRKLCFPDGFQPSDIKDAEEHLKKAQGSPPPDLIGFFAVMQISAMMNEKFACKK